MYLDGCEEAIFAGAESLKALQGRWLSLKEEGVTVAVLATAIPKCTAIAFLEGCEEPGDTFTALEYGDYVDIVVYRDPLLQHEVGSNLMFYVRDAFGAAFGRHNQNAGSS